MKKIFPLFFIIFMLSLVLTGCSESTTEAPEEKTVDTSTTKEAEAKKKTEAKAKKEKDAEIAKKAEADKKAKAKITADKEKAKAKKEAEEKKLAEEKQAKEDAKHQAYREEVIVYTTVISETMGSFSEDIASFNTQTMLAANDPMLMMDDTWIMDTVMSLVYLQEDIDAINATKAPKGFEEIQSYNEKIANEWQFVVDNFPTAIDNMDVDLINECTAHIKQGTEYTDIATELLTEISEELQISTEL